MKKLIYLLPLVTIIVLTNCSKERIQEEEKNEYESMNDYFDSKKQEEQDFVIDTGGTCPVVGNQGTRVCPIKVSLQTSGGDSVYFPFNMHLIELYTPKDIIYYQLSNFGGSNVISNHGIIRLRATKDGDDLSMRAAGYWDVEQPNATPTAGKSIYYSSGGSNWTTSGQSFAVTAYGYDGDVTQLSWVSCAEDPAVGGSTGGFTFSSDTDNLDNVVKYVYLPDLDALVKASGNSTIALPVGQSAKVILMAINSKGELYHYYDETTVGATNDYKVELTEISDGDLTTLLDGL